MADLEAPWRRAVTESLCRHFQIGEEVPVRLHDGNRGVIDVVAVPLDNRFSNFPFAIEVKSCKRMVEEGLPAWIKQASDYVIAQSLRSYRVITHSFLWMVGMTGPENELESFRLRAMIDVAHQFWVGVIRSRPRQGIVFQMGPDDLFRENGWRGNLPPSDPWAGKATERLTSTRQSAGVRRAAAGNTLP